MGRNKDTSGATITAESQQNAVSEGIDSFELPKSLVTKIAKAPLPEEIMIRKEAILALMKGSAVFINLLGATAHDVATQKQHKSVSASDVLKALEIIQCSDIIAPLQAELQIYRNLQKSSRKSTSNKPAKASESLSQAPVISTQFTEPTGPPHFIPNSSKSKGKGRASQMQQDSEDAPMEVDNEIVDGEQEDEDVEEVDVAEDVPEAIDEDEDEQETIADQVALEEEELMRDAQGLDPGSESE